LSVLVRGRDPLAGLKVETAAGGRPETSWKPTGSGEPDTTDTVAVYCATWPEATVCVNGLTLTENWNELVVNVICWLIFAPFTAIVPEV
jgi:hypothetical protein